MFFGCSAFYQALGYLNSSSNLEELFKKENLTIEEILDEENILNEIKGGSQKFTNYMTKHPQHIKSLIDYVINEPDINEGDEKKCYKYPFISSEIFGAQLQGIANFMFGLVENQQSDDKDNSDCGQQKSMDDDEVKQKQYDDDDSNEDDEVKDENKEEIKEKNDNNVEDEEKTDQQQQEENKDQNGDNEEFQNEDGNEEENQNQGEQEEQKQQIETGNQDIIDQQQTKKEDESESDQNKENQNENNKNNEETQKSENKNENNNSEETKEEQSEDNKETSAKDNLFCAEDTNTDNYIDKDLEQFREEDPEKNNEEQITGQSLLLHLFSFLQSEQTLNPTSAGYFQKVCNLLVNRSGNLSSFLIENSHVRNDFVRHVKSRSIAEIIQKLIIIEGIDKKEDQFSNERIQFTQELFKKFQYTGDNEELENIGYIFIEIITASSNQERNPNRILDPVMDEIYKEQNLNILFNKIKTCKSYNILHAATILNALLVYSTNKSNNNQDKSIDEETVTYEKEDNFPMEQFVNSIDDFLDILKNDGDQQQHQTSYGQNITPFGIGKLKLLELFTNLLRTKNNNIQDKIASSDFYIILFPLLQKYCWNNLLHNLIEKTIYISIELDNQNIRESIFEKAKILDWLVTASSEGEIQSGKLSQPIRKGYLGFVTKISNYFIKLQQSWLETYINENTKFTEFKDGTLEKTNIRNNKTLGDSDPRKTEDQEDDSANKIDMDIQKIYEKFNNYFNQNSSSHAQDDDGDDDNDNGNEVYEDGKTLKYDIIPDMAMNNQMVEQEPEEPIEEEYNCHNYFKVDTSKTYKLDDLMSDM